MLSLDQIKVLERKIEAVVSRVMELTSENNTLKQKIDFLVQENQMLQSKVEAFESDQEKIEQGIISALDRLNTVENSVLLAAGVFKQEETSETDIQDEFNYNDSASDNENNIDDVESNILNNNLTNQDQYSESSSFDIF